MFRNVDFAIFDKDYKNILLLIELNDKTHSSKRRISRDLKVEKIVNQAGIKLIKFYSNYPNEKNYAGRYSWKNIDGVWRTKHAIYLYVTKQQALIIPDTISEYEDIWKFITDKLDNLQIHEEKYM